MARGFKIADAYVELTVNRDAAKEGVRDLPRDVGPDADRAGREIGDRIGKGLAAAVETWSARIAKARRAEVDAAAAVTLAEKRIDEARKRGVEGSSAAMLSLTQNLEKAQYRLSSAQAEVIRTTGQQQEAQKKLAASVAEMAEKAGPEADRGGRALGDKLSQGISMSIVRNSPLIVAGIAAALVAGAPLALAGATALFAGIGIVAAAQSEKVRSAWLGTWQGIKAGAQADARPIEDVLVRMASQVSAGFERMRPSLRNIFADAAPQIAVFTQGLLGLVENALPGFERAIGRSMPVTQGLAALLEKTGTGLSGFLDGMSEHSEAAGRALSLIGDVLAELLPMLGVLLGQGAELAVMVLPAVVSVLKALNAVLGSVGGALPMVLTGFMAFKVASTAAGWIGALSTSLGNLNLGSGAVSGAVGKVSSGLSAVSRAAGPVGIAIGIVATAMAHGEQEANNYATAMLKGGAAADQAFAEAGKGTVIEAIAGKIGGLGTILKLWTGNSEEAADAQRKLWTAMSPGEQITNRIAYWTAELSQRLNDESSSTAEVEAAKRRLAYWQQQQIDLANREAMAIRGVTEAMVEQADQSRSLVDSQFAYENAVNSVEDAQSALNDAIKEHGADSEEAQRATLALNEALSAQAQAARRVAESGLPASMDDSQRAILGAKAELDELNRIAAEYTLPPELEAHRQKLEAITGQADGAMLAQAQLAAAVSELGFAVSAVPGEKHITITAPTDELRQRLADLGFTIIELPNGDIEVIAETAEAQAKLGTLATDLVGLNNTRAVPTADLDTNPLAAKHAGAMNFLAMLQGQRPFPIASLNDAPLQGTTKTDFGLLDVLGGKRPTPVASLDPVPLQRSHAGAMNLLAMLQGQRPFPIAQLDANPLIASVGAASGQLGWLGGQRPTPVGALDTGPFSGQAAWMASYMWSLNGMNARPWATLNPSIGYADAQLNWAARNRTATIFANVVTSGSARIGWHGGPVSRMTEVGFDGGGKVRGPGGPTDDLVHVMGPRPDIDYRLSNTEWIIKALSSMRYGDKRMAAVNDGTATILLPSEVRRPEVARFAGGGSPGGPIGDRQVTTAPGRTVTVEHVTVVVQGTYDLASSSDLRKAALAFREALLNIEREQS